MTICYQELSMIPLDKLVSSPPCVNDTSTYNYLNSPETRKALHIPDVAQTWDVCR